MDSPIHNIPTCFCDNLNLDIWLDTLKQLDTVILFASMVYSLIQKKVEIILVSMGGATNILLTKNKILKKNLKEKGKPSARYESRKKMQLSIPLQICVHF